MSKDKNAIDPAKIKEIIIDFFAEADEKKLPKTLPALAARLLWTTDDLVTYPKEGAILSAIINHAKLRCENWLMEQMIQGRIDKSMAALILRMHFGYVDSSKKKETKRSIASILDEEEDEN